MNFIEVEHQNGVQSLINLDQITDVVFQPAGSPIDDGVSKDDVLGISLAVSSPIEGTRGKAFAQLHENQRTIWFSGSQSKSLFDLIKKRVLTRSAD